MGDERNIEGNRAQNWGSKRSEFPPKQPQGNRPEESRQLRASIPKAESKVTVAANVDNLAQFQAEIVAATKDIMIAMGEGDFKVEGKLRVSFGNKWHTLKLSILPIFLFIFFLFLPYTGAISMGLMGNSCSYTLEPIYGKFPIFNGSRKMDKSNSIIDEQKALENGIPPIPLEQQVDNNAAPNVDIQKFLSQLILNTEAKLAAEQKAASDGSSSSGTNGSGSGLNNNNQRAIMCGGSGSSSGGGGSIQGNALMRKRAATDEGGSGVEKRMKSLEHQIKTLTRTLTSQPHPQPIVNQPAPRRPFPQRPQFPRAFWPLKKAVEQLEKAEWGLKEIGKPQLAQWILEVRDQINTIAHNLPQHNNNFGAGVSGNPDS
jgi:uncharacterized membrane protein YgcG